MKDIINKIDSIVDRIFDDLFEVDTVLFELENIKKEIIVNFSDQPKLFGTLIDYINPKIEYAISQAKVAAVFKNSPVYTIIDGDFIYPQGDFYPCLNPTMILIRENLSTKSTKDEKLNFLIINLNFYDKKLKEEYGLFLTNKDKEQDQNICSGFYFEDKFMQGLFVTKTIYNYLYLLFRSISQGDYSKILDDPSKYIPDLRKNPISSSVQTLTDDKLIEKYFEKEDKTGKLVLLKGNPQLSFVLDWIFEHDLNPCHSKGALYERISKKIYISPKTLKEYTLKSKRDARRKILIDIETVAQFLLKII